MNILLTGATGFLGSNLLHRLIAIETHKIIVLKRTFSNTRRIDTLLEHPSIVYYNIDAVDLIKVFENNSFDAIIHTATEYGRNDLSTLKTIESNLIFPIRLLELAIDNGVSMFINTDSYFNKGNFTYSHLRNYSMSKRALIDWMEHFSKKIKICNMVLEHIYGKNDNADKFIQIMVDKITIQKSPSVDLTYGHQKRDFVFIDDVVDAYLKVLSFSNENNFRYRSFEVGTGNSVMIRELITTIKDLSASPTFLNFGSLPYRDDEIMNSIADITDLKNIGWRADHSLTDGLAKII